MLLETDGEWQEVPPLSAILFLPGQRHSYHAFGESYIDCWMHIESDTPLLFEGFPFGKPIPLGAGERFLSLFRIMIGEFYSARRNRVSVLDSLLSALLEMLSSEIGVSGTQFYPFLSLREEVFRFPENPSVPEDDGNDAAPFPNECGGAEIARSERANRGLFAFC